MSIHDNIAAGKYENKVPYKIERVPVNEETMTVKQAREHCEAEKRRESEQKKKHREEEGRLIALFKADLEQEYGLVGHPKAEALWSNAWDRGHSGGLSDVAYAYDDLSELIAS